MNTNASTSTSASIPTPPPSSSAQSSRRRAAKNLLRDYYVKPGGNSSIGGPGVGSGGSTSSSNSNDALKNAHQQFQQLYNNASLKELLVKDANLRGETGELESERQGLVYTRYHDLLDASDTIRKMKSRAESLDQSLESLQSNFERISQLCTSLSSSDSSAEQSAAAGSSSSTTTTTATPPAFDPVVHLPPVLQLPNTLRAAQPRTEAQQLWGRWEPVLRQWEEAGVSGVKDVAMECRDVLSQRARSNSLSPAATAS